MSKVLVVDDESDVRMVLSRRLRAVGFEVLEAGNGVAAVDIARAEKPDIVLLDVMMPGHDGIWVDEKLREDDSTRDIPVIFITALSAEAPPSMVEKKGRGKGEYLIFGKPYDPDDLLAAICRILGPVKPEEKR